MIEPAPGQMRQLLRLRRIRLDASEQAMRAAREALLAARGQPPLGPGRGKRAELLEQLR